MDLQGKLIFHSSPVLFLGFDCVKVRQVDDIWPYCRHWSPTDTTTEKNSKRHHYNDITVNDDKFYHTMHLLLTLTPAPRAFLFITLRVANLTQEVNIVSRVTLSLCQNFICLNSFKSGRIVFQAGHS